MPSESSIKKVLGELMFNHGYTPSARIIAENTGLSVRTVGYVLQAIRRDPDSNAMLPYSPGRGYRLGGTAADIEAWEAFRIRHAASVRETVKAVDTKALKQLGYTSGIAAIDMPAPPRAINSPKSSAA